MNDSVDEVCGSCDKKGPDLQKFTSCKTAWYCNVQCQKKDWKSHKQCCIKFGTEPQKGHDIGEGQSSSSYQDRVCAFCGKTGIKLRKCEACKSVRYCSTVCQKQDSGNHEKDCHVVKVYPEGVFTDLPDDTYTNFDNVTGKVTKHQTLHRDTGNGIGNFVATEIDMIVKIQTSVDFTIRPRLFVYNESRDYYVIIRGHDRYYDAINDKVLLEGLPCVRKDPRLRKLYVKAHLNSDSSLDIYLDCTYNIKNW